MPVYRYKLTAVDISRVAQLVPGAIALGDTGADVYTDITAPSGSKDDLDEVMSTLGWTFSVQDPIATPAQASAASTASTFKTAVKASTTANISLSGIQTVDGVLLAVGDRVLVKDQTLPEQNGIYVVSSGSWSRADDANTAQGLAEGMFLVVAEGTTQAGTAWALSTIGPIVVDTTGLTFDQFNSGFQVLTSSAPVNVSRAAAIVGTANSAARADHKHDVSTAAPVTIGTSNTEGTATSLARSDHLHAHGAQTDGTLHAVATTSVAGFMSSSDKTKLDGVATGATNTPLTSSAPADVTKSAAVVGVATAAARADHKHDISTASPSTTGTANSEGTATSLARSDHVHRGVIAVQDEGSAVASRPIINFIGGGITAVDNSGSDRIDVTVSTAALTSSAPADVTKSAAAVGVATDAARADHKHDISTAAPSTTGTANSEGTATSLARSDHVHRGVIAVQDEGSAVASRPILNFIGAAVSSVDNGGSDRIDITIAASALTSSAPADVTKSAAVVGVATDAARADHKHDISTAAPSTTGTANSEGTATSLARSDHVHRGVIAIQDEGSAIASRPTINFIGGGITAVDNSGSDRIDVTVSVAALTSSAPVNVTKSAAAVGVATDAARADHKHDITTAAPATIGTSNSEGTATSLARSDHVHNHGTQTDGTLHAVATISVAGFMSDTDKTKLDGISAGAAALTSSAPVNVTKSAAVVGVATDAARADHKHDVSTATPASGAVAVGNTSSEGTATSLARSDHTHTVAAAAPVDIGTANAAGSATTFVRSDHVHNLPFTPVQTALGAATGSISVNNQLITNVLDPVSAQDAATKVYVDTAIASNTDWKQSVRTATTANITLSGTQTIDGVAVIAGNRVLVKDQTTGSENGLYVVAAGAWTRTTDADVSAEVTCGLSTRVEEGTINGNSAWSLTTANPITVGTTSLTFTSFNLTSSAPVAVSKSAALLGSSPLAAHADHKHDVTTAAPTATGVAAAAAEGTATTLARSDHVHQSNTAPVDITKAAAVIGTSSEPARADHKHDVSTAAPSTTGTANSEGTSTALARADHIHRGVVAVQDEGSAVASRPTLNFIGSAITAVDNSGNDRIDITVSAAALTASAPADVTKSAAVVGVATDAARADHKHDISTAAPSTIGTANSEGTATSLARSDHVHRGVITVQDEGSAIASRPILNFIGAAVSSVDNGGSDRVDITIAAAALTSSAPVDVTKSAAVVGVATDAARADHKHDISTAAPSTTGTANSEGTATSLARSDHVHRGVIAIQEEGGVVASRPTINFIGGGITAVDNSGSDRIDVTVAVAALTSSAPVNVTKSAAAVGVATDAARADHKHDITTAAASGLTATTTNTEGTATSLARSDHTHAVSSAAPAQGIGGGNSVGTATTFARSDHDHTIRETGGPTDLTVGAIATTELFQRSGTTVVGIARGGVDSTAIHTNIASEISALTNKATPVAGDFLVIEDSAAANAKKQITISQLGFIKTKELFYPPVSNAASQTGNHNGVAQGTNAAMFLEFFIPADFVSLTSVEIICIPGVTNAAANIDFTSDYGSVGEAFNAHTQTDTTSTYSITSGQINQINASAVFSSLAAGDRCGLQVKNNAIGGSNLILGVRLKYV